MSLDYQPTPTEELIAGIKAHLDNEYDEFEEYYEDSEGDHDNRYLRCLEEAMKDIRALIAHIEGNNE